MYMTLTIIIIIVIQAVKWKNFWQKFEVCDGGIMPSDNDVQAKEEY